MDAGAFSDDAAVKAAAKNVIPVYVDCSNDGQNIKLQQKFKVDGYPTLLIVSPAEKILENWYPENGKTFAADLARAGRKYGPRPWISAWPEALLYAKEDRKPLVVVYVRDRGFKAAQAWFQQKLGKEYGQFVFAFSNPGTDERKKLNQQLGGNLGRVGSFVVVDPELPNPFAQPVATPWDLDEAKVVAELRASLGRFRNLRAGRAEWAKFTGALKANRTTANAMLGWARQLRKRFPKESWTPNLDGHIKDLETRASAEFQKVRGEIYGKHINGGKNQWGPAVTALRKWLARNPNAKAQKEVGALNHRAGDELKTFGKLKKAELLKHRPRFVGTNHINAFDALVKKASD